MSAGIALAGVIFIGGAALMAVPGLWPGAPQTQSGSVRIGGPFSLTSHAGETVTETDLLGKPSLVFFGFTHCPEVCPTTLYDITQVLDALGEGAAKANTVFISVDPERDTPAVLASYLSSFHPQIRGLTGPAEAIASTAKAYRVYYQKVPLENDDYTVDHTALVYLFDRRGNFVAPLNVRQEPAKAAEQVRKLL